MRGLEGKVGIVAGGARGIGAAIAQRLCAEGASVLIGDLMEDIAAQTAKEIAKAGGKCQALHLDATDKNSQDAIIAKALSQYGRLDFYHSNLAGGTVGDSDAIEIELDIFDRSVSINMKSHLLATKAALPALLEQGGGAMIYTSSGSASGAEPRQPAYAMSKNAIHALARHVASRWGRHGIRANVIAPGLIMTEAVAAHLDEKQTERLQRITPCSRLGQPEDIAALAAFLASEDGAFVNGQVWHINGGMQMRD